MSYRLIDSNDIAMFYPEVNNMPCIYADLDADLDCLNGRLYDLREPSTLQAENDKLRELVRDMCVWAYIDSDCDLEDRFADRMRELGMEACE